MFGNTDSARRCDLTMVGKLAIESTGDELAGMPPAGTRGEFCTLCSPATSPTSGEAARCVVAKFGGGGVEMRTIGNAAEEGVVPADSLC